ncbi:hypothetical protein FBU59_002105 [Linderina macrospora]|uniref:Uncharacterized protein n=1 Tax=Linderina macrospora TaxID=4868 RepID=A0ACC1JC96_9FUNG|nr:hypothetical protein FBU59_002105 [Linderina macrospora]
MAPQPPPSPRVQSGSHGRRHKASPFVNWLKKTDDTPDTSKLASPAEEIKLVFLHKLQLGDFDVDGKRYHSVFTGTQIVVSFISIRPGSSPHEYL